MVDESDQEASSSSKSREGLELFLQDCFSSAFRLIVFRFKPAMDEIEVEGLGGSGHPMSHQQCVGNIVWRKHKAAREPKHVGKVSARVHRRPE